MTNSKQQQIVEYDPSEAQAALLRAGAGQIQEHRSNETAASGIAERSRALVEARAIMAIRQPRSWDDVRNKLLAECRRPAFARAARYLKPIGKGVEGPSIRFAEAAIRCMRNISIETTVVYDDDAKLILRVSVTDLENNIPFEQDVVVTKTVERKNAPRGASQFRTRTNSFGETLYILPATDDECLNKTNALVSKALRTLVLRLLPGDILDEAMALCIQVAHDEDAKDPDAARKSLAAAFFGVGVTASQLAEYLGHDLAGVTPKELAELRALFAALRDAETSWAEIMEGRGSKEKTGAAAKVAAIVEKAKEKAKGKAKATAPATASPAVPPEQAPGLRAEDDGSVPADQEPPPREPGEEG